MGKWFEITAQATKVFVIEVDDEDGENEAINCVREEWGEQDIYVDEKTVRELSTENDLRQAKLLADEVCSL